MPLKILPASGSGSATLVSVAGTTTNDTLTLPARTGNIITSADTGTVTQAMLASNVAGNGPAFSAYSTSGTSISAGTFGKITYNTEEFDTNNNFSSSRFTPTVAGYYQISASVYFNATSSAERVVAIYKNGTDYKWSTDLQGVVNIVTGMSCLVYLNGTGDYIEVYGYSGNAITTGASAVLSFFQGALVRAG